MKLIDWILVGLGMQPRAGGLGQDPRFATFSAGGHSIVPNLDAIGPQRRIDESAPLLAATIGGRPVVLARPDSKSWRPGMGPADMTVPITISRFRRALDIESGRASITYDPSLVDDWPITHLPYG